MGERVWVGTEWDGYRVGWVKEVEGEEEGRSKEGASCG